MSARNSSVAAEIRHALGDHPDRGALTRLAEDVDTTVSTVSRWWSLVSSPEPGKWASIEDALGLERGSLAKAAEEDYQSPGDLSSLRAEVDRVQTALRSEIRKERDALRSEVQSLRDQVDELIQQVATLSTAVDVLRGAEPTRDRATSE